MNLKRHELENVVENLPVGVMVFDRQMRLRLWNDQALELTGIGVENILSNDYADLLDGEVRRMLAVANENIASYRQYRLIGRDGRSIGCTVKSVAGDSENCVILLMEDATKFMEVEKLKRDFIGTLLHKLRGPLSTLKTSLAMLQSGAIKGISPEAQEILGMGHHEVNRLVMFVADIRDLFLIETGIAEKDMFIERFPLFSALDRAVEELANMAPPFDGVRKRLLRKGSFNVNVNSDFEKLK